MALKKLEATTPNLSAIDDVLLDGLAFCGLVYDLFDEIRQMPDGIERLRLRKSKAEKRLIEELLPLAHYVQARYREGRRIKVRWLSGSQSYDAILWSSGGLVNHGMAPRRSLVEITGSMHENEYLARQLLQTQGGSWGVKGITRDPKTKLVTSKPHVHKNDEITLDLTDQILLRLESKAAKKYPVNTVLIMQCFANTLTLESEWKDAVKRVEEAHPAIPFRELFLVESTNAYTATIWGQRPRIRSRRSRKQAKP